METNPRGSSEPIFGCHYPKAAIKMLMSYLFLPRERHRLLANEGEMVNGYLSCLPCLWWLLRAAVQV